MKHDSILEERAAFIVRRALPVLIVVLLAACGGGGGDSSPTSPATPGSSGSTPPSGGGSGGTTSGALNLCGNATTIAETVAKINAKRAQAQDCRTRGSFAATTPLTWNARLAQAADVHSADMATQNYFSHTAPSGSTVSTRVTATGYNWSRVGENIAAGYSTVDIVIDGWMGSDGHCANIMSPNYTEYGFSCAFNSASTYRTYWTQVFATPR
jgi:uncharacterized protein YkwD